MGLISRVSSRTYRFTNSDQGQETAGKMQLRTSALLAALALSMMTYVRAEEDDVVIEDDEAEIEGTEPEDEPVVEEPAPQLSPTPLEGIRSFVYFPDGPASITGGKLSEVVMGVQNNGDKDIEMVSCNGRMMMPGTQEAVQNFTNVGYDNHAILSKSEASFSYAFMPHMQTGGREFKITLELIYKELGSNMYYIGGFSWDEGTVGVGDESSESWGVVWGNWGS